MKTMHVVVHPDGRIVPAVFTTTDLAEAFRAGEGITGPVLPVVVDPLPRRCRTTEQPDNG